MGRFARRSHYARFLEVAVANKFLRAADARLIAQDQRSLRAARTDPLPRVGEIAVACGFIDCGAVDSILELQKQLRGAASNRVSLADPVAFLVAPSPVSTRTAIICCVVVAVVVGFAVSGASGAIDMIVLVGGILSLLVALWPDLVHGYLPWHHRVQQAGLVLLLSLSGVFVFLATTASQDSLLDLAHTEFWNGATGYSIASVTFIAAMAAWRGKQARAFKARCLLSLALSRGSGRCVHDVLTDCVRQLSLNPYAQLVGRFVNTAVLVLYFEKHPTRPGRLVVRDLASSTVDEGLTNAWNEIAQKHFPVICDVTRFIKVTEQCGKGSKPDRVWRKKYFAQAGRSEYISLAGYVFATGQPIEWSHLERCLAFDRDYMGIFRGRILSKDVLRGLDFQSAVVYPVYLTVGSQQEVRGVVMALRPITNGFTQEDQATVRKLADEVARLTARALEKEQLHG